MNYPEYKQVGRPKVVYSLNVGGYAPEICALTYPAMQKWADKIGADFYVMEDAPFDGWPAVYQKLQIHTLAKEQNREWVIFLDSDAIVNHVEMLDPTDHLAKNEVLHWGSDMAGNRWSYDDYFRRDARHIGSGNWFTVASNWCLDLWKPLDDMTLKQASANIHPTINEQRNGIQPSHLIDDYTLSRNIARFGLKLFTFVDLLKSVGRESEAGATYFWHSHLLTPVQKKDAIAEIITRDWNPSPSPWDAGLLLLKRQAIGVELDSQDYIRWLQPTKFLFKDGDTLHVEVPTSEHKTVLSSKKMAPILKSRIPMPIEYHLSSSRLVAIA